MSNTNLDLRRETKMDLVILRSKLRVVVVLNVLRLLVLAMGRNTSGNV